MTTPPPPCGCYIKTHSYPHPGIECNEQVCPKRDGFWIEKCPLCLAAPRLRDALEELHKFTKKLNDERADDGDGRIDFWQSTDMRELLTRVEALLTSAKGVGGNDPCREKETTK